jgi:hypothetical protein
MRCGFRKKSGETENGGRRRRGKRTLLFGMLIGVALGLMFAPKPGSETIEDLRRMMGKMPF